MGRPKGKKSTMRTPQEKEALILEWRDSGLGLKRFARSNGIPKSSFRVWVARYRAGGLGALESKAGKGKAPGKGRPKKSMTMVEELELENLRLRIEVERLKKGYTVEGGGSRKEYVPLRKGK